MVAYRIIRQMYARVMHFLYNILINFNSILIKSFVIEWKRK